jgi:phospho-N-acetylmuramoyl-pentapeptide-transferase
VIAPILAGGIALLVSLLGTWWLTGFLAARGRSQPILVKDDVNIAVPQHMHKSGTPTMGGLAIIGAAGIGYLVSPVREGVVFSNQTLIMWGGCW